MRGAFPGTVLFVFVACSGAGNSTLTGPRAGDAGATSSSGGSGGSSSSGSSGGMSSSTSSGGSSSGSSGGFDAMAPGDDTDATSLPPQDAAGATCTPSPMAGSACNSIPAPASTITVECNASDPLPAAVGGVVRDGTYRMIAATYYADGMACAPPETDGVSWDICGTSWQISQNDSVNGAAQPPLVANATVVTAGTNITITLTCGLMDTQPIIYGYDADAQTLRIHTGSAATPDVGRVDTFARQ